jgi:hypothetical protein
MFGSGASSGTARPAPKYKPKPKPKKPETPCAVVFARMMAALFAAAAASVATLRAANAGPAAQGTTTQSQAKPCKLVTQYFELPRGTSRVKLVTKVPGRVCFTTEHGDFGNDGYSLWCTQGPGLEHKIYSNNVPASRFNIAPIGYDGKLFFAQGNCLYQSDFEPNTLPTRIYCDDANSNQFRSLVVVESQLWADVGGWHFLNGTSLQPFPNPGHAEWANCLGYEYDGAVYCSATVNSVFDDAVNMWTDRNKLTRFNGSDVRQYGPRRDVHQSFPVAVFNNKLLVSRSGRFFTFTRVEGLKELHAYDPDLAFVGLAGHTEFRDAFYALFEMVDYTTHALLAVKPAWDKPEIVYRASSELDALGVVGDELVFRADDTFMCYDGTSARASSLEMAGTVSLAATLNGTMIFGQGDSSSYRISYVFRDGSRVCHR